MYNNSGDAPTLDQPSSQTLLAHSSISTSETVNRLNVSKEDAEER